MERNIERRNGFLVLDGYKHELADEDKCQYWINIRGCECYFKPVISLTGAYNELIAYHSAKLLGIDCAFYDLAIFNGEIGVISPNIGPHDKKLVTAEEILNEYLSVAFEELKHELIKKAQVEVSKGICVDDINNLEVIEKALEYRYGKTYGSDALKKLMVQTIKRFLFALVLNDTDKRPENYMYIEGESVEAAAMIDNEQILMAYKQFSLTTNFKDSYSNMATVLKEFLNKYHKDYLKVLEDMLATITAGFEKVIIEVESQIGQKLPDNYKETIRRRLKENTQEIKNTIEWFCARTKITGVYKPKKKVRYKKIA